jgi:hypothetical protein
MTSSRWNHRLVAIALTCVALGATTLWPRASAPAVTRRTLDSGFDAGIRNLVIEWDAADVRPAPVRRDALFGFIYQTFRASAWIPQSLFDRNVVTQAIVGNVDTIVSEKVGLVLWRDNRDVRAFGMAPNVDRQPGEPLQWTVNCLTCHMAEIDGVAYFGAGTKTFDDYWLGEALKRLTSDRWRRGLEPGSTDERAARDANRILNSHHHDKIDSLTRARSTAFAASHVEMYLRSSGGAMPAISEVGRGDVKTPPLWHTIAKMPVQRWYTDGSFHGPFPLMASSMELEKDRSFDELSTIVIPIIKQQFDSVIRYLRPPRYPYAIDPVLAERGRRLFYSSDIGCYRCHGTYDGKGDVEWPGVHVEVGTDRSRLELVSSQFVEAFVRSPLSGEGRLQRSRGYAATPLTGVWANYPYLHNGSVPTLHALLGPVSERPTIFEVMAARTLDRSRVGQPLTVDPRTAVLGEPELLRRFGGDRNWFNAERPGSSNAGHDFWKQIGNDANRVSLIEYLKTL